MIDFKEKYKKLYEETSKYPRVSMSVIPTEQRGDDCGTSLLRQFVDTDLSLFLLSEVTAYDGFVENYCLDEEQVERIRIIRRKKEDDPSWREKILKELEAYLPIPYSDFKKLPLGIEESIIEKIKSNQSEEERAIFEEKFGNLTESFVKKKV